MSEREIVLSYHNSLIRESDYKLLNSKAWINDSIIEFWFEYLYNDLYKDYQEKLLCISPSLSQLIKLTDDIVEINAILKHLDITTKDLILIPVNDNSFFESVGGSHWTLLVYNARLSSFQHFDSSINSNNHFHAFNIATKLNQLLSPRNKNVDIKQVDCCQQEDSYNCGVHVICNADAVCKFFLQHDSRPISEIASKSVIKGFRNNLMNVINNLRVV